MKDKTVFAVLSVVLSLLFTTVGYGWWGKAEPLEVRESLRPHGVNEPLRAHVWQDDIPCQSPAPGDSTSDPNVVSAPRRAKTKRMVLIRFGSYCLLFVQLKSEPTSDKQSETFSSEK